MSSADPPPRHALRCERCGGALVGGADPDQLRCSWCDTGYLRTSGSDVEAAVPAGRLGRRRIVRSLATALRRRGIEGFALQELTLVFLPFWDVRAKLVGWQQYRRRIEDRVVRGRGVQPTRFAASRLELVEEMVARPVHQTLPACDARRHGLLGIADRLDGLRLRPFPHENWNEGEQVHAVVLSRSSALRLSQSLASGGLAPPGAVSLRQRLNLIRARLRLVYYPVWWIEFTVNGLSCEASLDGLRGNVLRGSIPVQPRSPAAFWLAVGAASGWLAGLHPLPGAVALGIWVLHRLRGRASTAHERSLAKWLSEELAVPPTRMRSLADP